MKYLVYLLIPLSLLFQNCGSQTPTMNPADVRNVIQQRNFTFMATRAIPSASDINNIIVNMPNRNSSRILELDEGYTLKIEDGVLSADLPYFGRVFHPTYGVDNQGLKFSTTNFTFSEKTDTDKVTITIQPQEGTRVNVIFLDIYNNGRSYLSVNSNDRQPISYHGYIMTNRVNP